MNKYILGIDQSTQGTKAMLFDAAGHIVLRIDKSHRQIINEKGWVAHDAEEIMENIYGLIREIMDSAWMQEGELIGLGISNQRETAMCWDRQTGKPLYHAIVWQCARGADICAEVEKAGHAKEIQARTGLQLSPYFSAAKIAWVLRHVPESASLAKEGRLCCGTMDSWLIYNLTKDHAFKTNASNASRTQLFNINTMTWDPDICGWFQIPEDSLAQVCDSNALFGYTDFGGILKKEIPIHGVLGDSHGALFGQGCLTPGSAKVTYGTGSSVMMNIGSEAVFSQKGVVTSLAWRMDGKTEYVLEGNINYTGAIISWLQNDLHLIDSAKETADLAAAANPADQSYLVPAFTGLGAPYWDADATAAVVGMTRVTGKNEIVRAALDAIAYQIADIVRLMQETADIRLQDIRVDGGPTRNAYLMQFQSDQLQIPVQVPDAEEFSAMGPAFAAGIALGFYDKETIFSCVSRKAYTPKAAAPEVERLYQGWRQAVAKVLTK